MSCCDGVGQGHVLLTIDDGFCIGGKRHFHGIHGQLHGAFDGEETVGLLWGEEPVQGVVAFCKKLPRFRPCKGARYVVILKGECCAAVKQVVFERVAVGDSIGGCCGLKRGLGDGQRAVLGQDGVVSRRAARHGDWVGARQAASLRGG